MPDSISLRGSMQGMAVWGNYAVTVRDKGQCVIFDLRRSKMVALFDLPDNQSHCNNACFDSDGLLYVSSCFGDRNCMVYQIFENPRKHNPTLIDPQIIRTIHYNSTANLFAQDWCLDSKSGNLYAYDGKRGGTLYLERFSARVGDLKGATITLSTQEVLDTMKIDCVEVAQGSKIANGYAYLPDGDTPGQYFLHIIHLATQIEILSIDLSDINLEPEGVDVKGRNLYLSFNAPSPKDNLIVRKKLPSKRKMASRL